MKCLLKVNLDDEQCRAVDAACVQQTARAGALVNRSDLVRLWIAAGCPVVPEQVVGNASAVPRVHPPYSVNTVLLGQPPKPASADSAAAPVAGAGGRTAPAVGEGYRYLTRGEVIEAGDEFCGLLSSTWHPASARPEGSIGEKFDPSDHFPHRRKLPAAVVAGSEKALRAEPPAASGNAGGADARPARAPIEKPKGGVL